MDPTYVALSARLAQFLQLAPSPALDTSLCSLLEQLEGSQHAPESARDGTPSAALLPPAAVDDLLLLSLHKLLAGYVAESGSPKVQEAAFRALRVVLDRSAGSAQASQQKLLSFVQR